MEKGQTIGEVKDETLYLAFKKDGKPVSYETYLKD